MVFARSLRLIVAVAALSALAGCGSGDAPTAGTNRSGVSTAPVREAADPAPPAGYGYVYRFAKISNGAYFYTGNAGERDQILASFPDFRYEGIAFLQNTSGTSTPVYRFANLGNGGYFYTANTAERDEVIRSRKDMRFEGSTFAVAPESDRTAAPVYRLANLRNGAYLYTYNSAERDFAVGLGVWRYEGVSFNAAIGTVAPIVTKEFEVISGGAACGSKGCSADSPDGAGVGGGDSAGVGGDGGVGGASGESAARNVTIVAYKPDGTVLGSAPLVNNLVSIYPRTYKGPFILKMVDDGAGEYWDEATRQWMPLAGQVLHAMVPAATHHVSINPLTEAAYQLAVQQLRGESSLNAATMKQYNDIVLVQINAKLPAAYQINDITNYATTLDHTSGPDSLPNTWAGRYSSVLAGMPIAGVRFNGKLGAPALDYGKHLAADLLDDQKINASVTPDTPAYDTKQASLLLSGICTSTATWGSTDLPALSVATAGSTRDGELSLLAGSPDGTGNCDGVGKAARFAFPSGLASDAAGNIYVADTYNSLIRKISPSGRVTTLAGSPIGGGSADGKGNSARFYQPGGVAADGAGNVYVVDSGNATVRKIATDGTVTTLAGRAKVYGSADGAGSAARFKGLLQVDGTGRFGDGGVQPVLYGPSGLAVDARGTLFVSDTFNHTIRRVAADGSVTTIAGSAGQSGTQDGAGSAARFNRPVGLAVDAKGDLWVADSGNSTIRKITSSGQVSTVAGIAGRSGFADGRRGVATLGIPLGVILDAAGNLIVTDFAASGLRKIAPDGTVTTLGRQSQECQSLQNQGTLSPLSTDRFCQAFGITRDPAGNMFVAESLDSIIRRILPIGVDDTFAGSEQRLGYADGKGAAAEFRHPSGITRGPDGNFYLTDTNASTIRKITPAGEVTTYAGKAGERARTDGSLAVARFFNPVNLAFDLFGNLFVVDNMDHTIRKIGTDGRVITFAGSPGQSGSADGAGAAARFSYPGGIAVDAVGNVHVYDCGNQTIRKISQSGNVITLAGSAGQFGSTDGKGSAARFGTVFDGNCNGNEYSGGLAFGPNGILFLADQNNGTIRRIAPDGTVDTFAGNAGEAGSTDGLGPAARFWLPRGLTFDRDGNLYVSEIGNHLVRRITPSGAVTTIVGTPNVATIQTGPLPAALSRPTSLAIDADRKLYIVSGNGVLVATPPAGGWR